MKLLLCYFCVLNLVIGTGHCNEVYRVVKVLHALTRGLYYFQERVSEINLDAVFSVRVVQEQLQAFLTHDVLESQPYRHWIEVLRDKAKRIADQGSLYVRQKDPRYAAKIGYWMDGTLRNVWHPMRNTSEEFVEARVPCLSLYDNLNGTQSDICFSEIGANETNRCNISTECLKMNTKQYQRDYVTAHQMLYWWFMESYKCADKVPEELQQRFCSNIMRDAKLIASADFPESHRDLFMEQVGLCGLWGFSDFNKPDWIDRIVDWQEDSGCYSGSTPYYCTDDLLPDPPVRVKRWEKVLSDNCLAHKTAVAFIALVTNLRFEAEKTFQGSDKSKNLLM